MHAKSRILIRSSVVVLRHAVRKAVALAAAFGICGGALGLSGCAPRSQTDTEQTVTDGVIFRSDSALGIQTLTADLNAGTVRPAVVAKNVTRIRNNFVGDAKTVAEWAREYDAVGGVNAGFFGETYDPSGHRKQLVQLAVVGQKVVAPGSATASTAKPGETYLRSAIGFSEGGRPEIVWATGKLSTGPRRAERVISPKEKRLWEIESAVACGPRLVHDGKLAITDREERLISPGRLARAFVAYDRTGRYLVLGRADESEFSELAAYLVRFFSETLHAPIEEAMCLDGGPSAQLVYRAGARVVDVEPTGVQVPTAILLLPKR